MQYTIPEISNGVAKVQFSDGSWIHIELTSDMTEADLDDAVHRAVPPTLKTGSTPSFCLRVRHAPLRKSPQKMQPILVHNGRKIGKLLMVLLKIQLEYITENGLEAWQTKVAEIKAANPKS